MSDELTALASVGIALMCILGYAMLLMARRSDRNG